MLSADFAGAAAAWFEQHYDMALFVNGSAGDMSTRFTRSGCGFEECERFGLLVRDAVENLAALDVEEEALRRISLTYHHMALKRAEIPDLKTADADLAAALDNLENIKRARANAPLLRKAESLVEGARINLVKAKTALEEDAKRADGKHPYLDIRAALFTVNKKVIVCSPFELFSTLALQLRKDGAELFGYANELYGYLADRAAYDNSDYEALFSVFARGEGERYIENIKALLPLSTNPEQTRSGVTLPE
ncbi:MAG: hypothetical protein LBJ31_02075 [Treponema sp.]|nr:hypothetical protein [Treponema sp.]